MRLRFFTLILILLNTEMNYTWGQSDSGNNPVQDTSKAWEHMRIAELLYTSDSIKNALRNFEKAAIIFESNLGKQSKEYAYAQKGMGDCYSSLQSTTKAITAYAIALKNLQIDTNYVDKDIGHMFQQMGNLYFESGNFKLSLQYYRKSLYTHRNIYGEGNEKTSFAYSGIGNAFTSLGNLDSAIYYINKSFYLNIPSSKEMKAALILSYYNLARAYHKKGESLIGIECLNKGLDILEKSNKTNNIGYYVLLMAKGNCYNDIGNWRDALLCFNKSLNIMNELYKEEGPEFINIYVNIGNAYLVKQEYYVSIDYYEKAQALVFKQFRGAHPSMVTINFNLATCNYWLADYDRSFFYTNKTIELINSYYGGKYPNFGDVYMLLGNISMGRKRTDEAIRYYETAIEKNKSYFDENHPSIGKCYNNLAMVYLKRNECEKAIDNCLKAEKIFLSKDNLFLAETTNNIADIYIECRQDYNNAISYFDRAMSYSGLSGSSYEKVVNPAQLRRSLFRKGDAFLKWYQKSDSSEYLLSGFDAFLQGNRFNRLFWSEIQLGLSKEELENATHSLNEGAVHIAMQLYNLTDSVRYLNDVYEWVSASKSVVLHEAIRNSHAHQYADIPDSIIQRENWLKTQISFYANKKHEEEKEILDKADSYKTSVLGEKIFETRKELDSLISLIERGYPLYKQLKYDLSALSTQEAQMSIVNDFSTLADYYVADSSIFLFLINQNDYQIKEIKKDFPLEDWISQLQSGLSAYHALPPNDPRRTNTLRDSCEQQYLAAARNLYDKLLKPVAPLLKEEVIIVPDGVLGYVPFEVLLTDTVKNAKRYHEYPYLLRQHRIRYTYSATLLQEMMDKKHRREPEKRFGAFAPYYDGDTTVLAGLDDLFVSKTVTPGALQPLKYSGAEVAAAQKLMGGDVFTDTTATEDRFNAVAGNYRILHLSTHGKADDRVGDYSYLVFSPSKDSVENELLYCRDIYNLSLNADLVVLSACETGLGKLSRGEGIISLARAFAYAGAKSIVNSLWSVNDASTEQLMVGFYKGLKTGQRKSAALAEAKRRFLAEPAGAEKKRYEKLGLRWEDFRHPYYWGGFILIGDDAAVK